MPGKIEVASQLLLPGSSRLFLVWEGRAMSSRLLQLGMSASEKLAVLEPLVIPVRYVARGDVVHATSTALSTEAVQVRSAVLPRTGVPIDLKLFFPGAGVISQHAIV
jgi:hypothetical protein